MAGTDIRIIEDSGWILPTLLTDVTLNNGTYNHRGYRRVGKTLFLEIALTIANPAANKSLFNLPAGFRPVFGEIQLVADVGASLRIRASDGLVRAVGASGTAFVVRAFSL